MIKIELPVCPSVNGLYANKAGKGRVKSKRYREWANAAGWEVRAKKPVPIMGPYRLSIWLSDDEASTWDLTNRVKAAEDFLVDCGLIQGDKKMFNRALYMAWSKDLPKGRMAIEVVEEVK